MAAKAVRPLPVLHAGLSEESQVRRRYVDLIVRQQARDNVRLRSEVMRALRDSFQRRDFLEIETPMLQVIPSGASARPFVTHMNAFDLDLRSEEHTSELQSRGHLVCRLLLEK